MPHPKYDRQLRLWGQNGQYALSNAHVVVLGATATSTEILKNLVLPGVGFFTLVDERLVDEGAMGNNFLVDTEDYLAGKSLATTLVENLCKLNPQTCGVACVEPCAKWVERFIYYHANEEAHSQKFPTLIVTTPRLPSSHTRRLAEYLRNVTQNIPLVYVQTCGLAGLIHLQERERLLLYADQKQETRVADLRIFNPFPELRQWFDKLDPRNEEIFRVDPAGRSHIPWTAIIYYALQNLRLNNQRSDFVPRTKMDYDSLRESITSLPCLSSHPSDGFLEAIENCRTALNRPSCLPTSLHQLLEDPRVDAPFLSQGKVPVQTTIAPACWAVLRGIKRFMAQHNGIPPLCGYVPDMSTTTQWYGEMCAIYAKKMEEDCSIVSQYACEELGIDHTGQRENTLKGGTLAAEENNPVTRRDIELLTKELVENLWDLQLVQFSPGLHLSADELLRREPFEAYLEECSTRDEKCTVMLYAALLGARCFEEMHTRWPGDAFSCGACPEDAVDDDDLSWVDDGERLAQIVRERATWVKNHADKNEDEDILIRTCMEVARCSSGEPFPTACIVAAAAAQECIKLLQYRRVPIQRPMVFDGYRGCFWIAEAPECGVQTFCPCVSPSCF
uniref:NEDD8-activating enzyme E1 regulatory subunit n=1 Tax=Trypanosoma congolense (strain IL3000) TaxID=1068625 RepID=G0UJD0_TRYCI|nr:unnamed protein product [Trypanosoma congolense IL3000]